MKILHVIKATGIAGAEKHLLTLIPGLRARGVDARLIALIEPDRPVDELQAAAETAAIPFERVVIHANADLSLIPRLRALFRAQKPAVVHTHLLHADLYGIPAARLARVAHVVTSRHNDDDFRRAAHWRMIHRTQWRMVDAGIAISDAIRSFCIDVEGAPLDKMHTVHYGLNADLSPNPVSVYRQRGLSARRDNHKGDSEGGGALRIGMICRLIPQKGVHYGIDAFAHLAPDFPDARLIIAGDGDLRADLEAQCQHLGIQDRVEFLGWQADIHPIMASLDIFLMPSLWEGFGLVLLEAMAHDLPIVASRVSAIPEIIVDDETGLLVPPRDVEGLVSALRRLLSDPALRLRLGSSGGARLREQFSADKMIDATMTIYKNITQRHRDTEKTLIK